SGGHAGEQCVHGKPDPDQARRADRDLTGPDPQRRRDALRRRMGVLEPGRTRTGVGAARVEHDRAYPSTSQYLLAPQYGRRLDPVAGEHTGREDVRPVVDDERDILATTGLQPGRDPASPEPAWMGDGHDAGSAEKSTSAVMMPPPRKKARRRS